MQFVLLNIHTIIAFTIDVIIALNITVPHNRFGGSLFALNRLFTSTMEAFNTEYELQEVCSI